MRTAKAFYFLFFAAGACLIPFLALHYQRLGLSGQQIGVLTGIVPLITWGAALAWGALADATRKHHLLLLAAIAGLWLSIFAMTRVQSFAALIPVVCLVALFIAPINPLVDNSVMTQLGGRKREYGRIRVWGSYGWGFVAIFIGILIERRGLPVAFTSYLFLTFLLFFVGIRLPVHVVSAAGQMWMGIRSLLGNGRWLLFLFVAMVEGMSLGIFLNYLFIYLEEMGASALIMGLSLTAATISEIPIFLYSKKILLRWGAPMLLAGSLLATAVRAFAYLAMTVPWQVLPISLLHGPTFAALWAAGVSYADETAPAGLGATAQGMFGGAVTGLGMALGAFSGGFLYDAYGAASIFQWAGWSSMVALVVFVIANWHQFSGQVFARASTGD